MNENYLRIWDFYNSMGYYESDVGAVLQKFLPDDAHKAIIIEAAKAMQASDYPQSMALCQQLASNNLGMGPEPAQLVQLMIYINLTHLWQAGDKLAQLANQLAQFAGASQLHCAFFEAGQILSNLDQPEPAKNHYRQYLMNNKGLFGMFNTPHSDQQRANITQIFHDFLRRDYKDEEELWKNWQSASPLGEVKANITQTQEEKIIAILQLHEKSFLRGDINLPPLAKYMTPQRLNKKQKILVFGQEFLMGNKRGARKFWTETLVNSLEYLGMNYRFFNGDYCMWPAENKKLFPRYDENGRWHPSKELKLRELAKLRALMAEFHPDVVVIDSIIQNDIKNDETIINYYDWVDLKKEFGFQCVFIATDFYELYNINNDIYEGYFDFVDLFIPCENNSRIIGRYQYAERIFSLLFHPIVPVEIGKKLSDFFFSGDAVKRDYLYKIPIFTANAKINFNHRVLVDSPNKNIIEYLNILVQAKITFTTGYRSKYFSMATGRAHESVVCKTLLMFFQNNTDINNLYIPYVHYIPVAHESDMMIYTQFFLKHEEWRSKITEQAFQFWQAHYSPWHYWSAIQQRLNKLL